MYYFKENNLISTKTAKSRRLRRDFPGAERVLKQLKEKSESKRVGLVVEKGIARSLLKINIL